jgi:serine/threonine protein kinase
MSSDRNLLFGILAVQSGFCTGPQLVEAMNAWTLAKDRPLGDILVERGYLQRDEHDLLTALVAKQLSKHGGDVEKSLASMTPVPRLKAELRQIQDSDLQQSLAAMPSSRPEDPDHTRTHETSSTGEAVRYRILRPHARGGLGEVYVARDEELGREVALKEIQSTHAHDPNSRGRFVREAEVTGGLEHPGIVAVYGLGSYADGRPFYAMRFIQGDSLKEAIDRFHKAGKPDFTGTEFRQLLGRFVDVCQAIAYAHSRGVLHRDLKPGNIMLGKFGETLVVDWGLAKVVGTKEVEYGDRTLNISSGSGSTPTMQGQAIGTPAFMSPEQAAGRLDELGPATDVYSLGATLYSLLANRPPIDADRIADALRKAERGEWTPLREVNAAIPKPLAAICAKAMALKSGDRYDSAQTMAADVERYLADEPVSTYRDPLHTHASRWARKHPTTSVSVAAALLFGTASMGIVLAVESERNNFVNEANRRAIGARLEAGQNSSQATREHKRANQHLKVALDVISTLVFDAQRFLESRSDTKPLREKLLNKAKEKLDELMKSRPELAAEDFSQLGIRVKLEELTNGRIDRSAGHTLFAMYVKLGDDARHFEGPIRAKANYERALWVAESLLQTDPSDALAKFHAACALALTWSAVNADKTLSNTSRQESLGEYKGKALDRLRQAVSLGFSDSGYDAAAVQIRQWPEYAEILAGIKANAVKKSASQPPTPKAKQ